MSFTQEKETNLHTGPNGTICDGCEKHCKFGIHYFYRNEPHFLADWFCPTIDGKPIKQYKGPNAQIIDASRIEPCRFDEGPKTAIQQAIELAHEIVKFCDNYKVK